MTSDSFVVRPLRFPGGSIGELAVNGTVNDLAMAGAAPLALTLSLVLEEGLDSEVLRAEVAAAGAAARAAGIEIVGGDTKVVERGAADGMYVCTAGVGLVDPRAELSPGAARPGDRLLVSGPIAEHGIAGEANAAGKERHVVGRMPGRRERRQRPDDGPVGERDVRVRSHRCQRRAGSLAQLGHGAAVVAVVVGQQDRAEPAAGVELGEQRVEVPGDRRAGVDHVCRVASDDPAVGAAQRVEARVRRAQVRDVVRGQRGQSNRPAGRSSRLRTVARKSAASAP